MNQTATPALVGPFRRLAAIVYDALLLLGIVFLATLPWVLIRGNPDPEKLNFEPLGLAYQVFIVALIFGYFALGWCRGGRTLGMRSWRMQLVGRDGAAVTLGQAALRFLAAFAAWLPLGAGVFWQYLDRDGLTWHDRWSGTRLVLLKKRPRGRVER